MSDARLIVPAPDREPWPTLGPEVCDWVETYLVFGPGDVLGEPITLTDELRLLIYRAYEVYPRDHRLAGRRRFKRVVFSRRKGVGKTEIAAWVSIAEMDPGAPVRCDGWREEGGTWVPVGRPVRDPYIPMVAVTEEQTADLAYAAVREILERCPLADEYDIGLERIVHKRAPGKMQALASAPSARDGARTSFQHFDETHLFTSEKLRDAHATMMRNIPKRKEADAWSFETSTMYAPGEESVAEASHRYAEAVARGEVKDSRLLFDHRQASEVHDISTKRGLMAAIREASGDAWAFTDAESIAAQLVDPQTDENDFRRYWLNQRRKSSRRWLSRDTWDALAVDRGWPEDGARVVLAFDGSYSRDSTILVGATLEEHPYLFLVRAWEKPLGAKGWRTPRAEVDAEIEAAMERWQVLELTADPPGWGRELEDWQDRYGGDTVATFDTNRPALMGPAVDAFEQAVRDGELSHDGSEVLSRHIGNCVPVARRGYTVVSKDAPDSPDKVDAAVASVIAFSRAVWHYQNRPDDGPIVEVVFPDGGEPDLWHEWR